MTIAERLRVLVDALPPDASVTVPRAWLEQLLDQSEPSASASARDLTVKEVAAETHRAASTVRGWLTHRELRGYKLNGRDWRVPRTALDTYLHYQATRDDVSGLDGGVDIGAWRKLRGEP